MEISNQKDREYNLEKEDEVSDSGVKREKYKEEDLDTCPSEEADDSADEKHERGQEKTDNEEDNDPSVTNNEEFFK